MRKPVTNDLIRAVGNLAFPETVMYHSPDGKKYLVTVKPKSYYKFGLTGREVTHDATHKCDCVSKWVVNLGTLQLLQ